MISYKRTRFVILYVLLDTATVMLAFFVTAVAWNVLVQGIAGVRFAIQPRETVLALLAFVTCYPIAFGANGLYLSRRLERGAGEVRSLAKASLLALLASTFIVSSFVPTFPTVFNLVASIAAFTLAWVARRAARHALWRYRKAGCNIRHAVIVGSGPRAVRLLGRLTAHPELGYRITGYVDDRPAKTNGQPSSFSNIPYLGNVRNFLERVAEIIVDEVFVALPIKSKYDEIRSIIQACEEQGILVRLPFDLFDLRIARPTATELDGMPVVTLFTGSPLQWKWAYAKRVLDLMGAGIGLVLLSPLFALTAILVKLSSPGPVLFKQKRVGLNKRVFEMYKFRTMYVDAEQRLTELESRNEADGPVFKIRNDPRVTPIGRWLRRFSLDELPQLINVLKGDMSLVGPRPLPLRDVARFETNWARRRFSVRPGLTCLWQTSGRSDVGFEQWMRMDLDYIDNWSIALDLRLLLRTIPSVLRGEGAY